MNNWFLKNLRKATIRGKTSAMLEGRIQGRHRAGCGKDFPCPTHIHGPKGESFRPSRTKKAKSWAREILPPEQATLAEGNPTPESGGA